MLRWARSMFAVDGMYRYYITFICERHEPHHLARWQKYAPTARSRDCRVSSKRSSVANLQKQLYKMTTAR